MGGGEVQARERLRAQPRTEAHTPGSARSGVHSTLDVNSPAVNSLLEVSEVRNKIIAVEWR